MHETKSVSKIYVKSIELSILHTQHFTAQHFCKYSHWVYDLYLWYLVCYEKNRVLIGVREKYLHVDRGTV